MRNVIVTEVNKCVRCMACEVACKIENDTPLGHFFTTIERIGPNPINEGDTFPNVEMYFLPMKCQHCETPECIEVCPTGASAKAEDGTVQIDEEVCIGCQLCIAACPYGVRFLNEEKNVVQKCKMCKQLTDKDELPRCVAACTGQALHFGDLDDPDSDVSKMVADWGDKAYKLPDSGNKPSNVYLLDKFKWRETWKEGTNR